MYCYLQINMHEFRVLLLLPFVAAHFLFYFMLPAPPDVGRYCFKKPPLRYLIVNPSLIALQAAKVKHSSKSCSAAASPARDTLSAEAKRALELVRIVIGHRYLASRVAAAFNPATLFPTRASPA